MNIDECCYGKEPAASQLAALRAEAERLGKERDAAVKERDELREAVAGFAANETDFNETIAELRAENERLRGALRAITFISSGPAAIDIAKRAMEKGREA